MFKDKDPKSLTGILLVPEAVRLEELIIAKGNSPKLDALGDPEAALKFARANLCGSYLFARFAVPSYASVVFSSLTAFPPTDDRMGKVLADLVESFKGELLTNNIFNRPGECHAHYHDALEAYQAAGGDMVLVERFRALNHSHGFENALEYSGLWSAGSANFAYNLLKCTEDVLTMLIMMPANEALTPKVYARAVRSLSREPRFDKLRTFLSRHVTLDQDDHGPAVLRFLDAYVNRTAPSQARIRVATQKVIRLFGG